MKESICYFSTGICESLTCCKDNKWNKFGYPINDCPKYPCEKYKSIVLDIAQLQFHDSQSSPKSVEPTS